MNREKQANRLLILSLCSRSNIRCQEENSNPLWLLRLSALYEYNEQSNLSDFQINLSDYHPSYNIKDPVQLKLPILEERKGGLLWVGVCYQLPDHLAWKCVSAGEVHHVELHTIHPWYQCHFLLNLVSIIKGQ